MEGVAVSQGDLLPASPVDPSFWKGRRVLLTGHTGFKGSWLALWLVEMGAEVTGLALEPESVPSLGSPLFSQLDLSERLSSRHRIGDIRHHEVVREAVTSSQPEVVFHLAAQALVRRSYKDPLGTWSTNVQGSLHVLDALRDLIHPCAVVMVTTDKVYENRNWTHGYRETDRLGGHDPYSASKAAAELAIASWRASFCGNAPHQNPWLAIATARAGNVIGGGDWAEDRLIPDAMRSLAKGLPVRVRHPESTRPWQHVLEPLSGYLVLAQRLLNAHSQSALSSELSGNPFASSFNFGPGLDANRSVAEVVRAVLDLWPGSCEVEPDKGDPHEAGRLHLQIDKAHYELGWQPKWDFLTGVARTVGWYCAVHEGSDPWDSCCADIRSYQSSWSLQE